MHGYDLCLISAYVSEDIFDNSINTKEYQNACNIPTHTHHTKTMVFKIS